MKLSDWEVDTMEVSTRDQVDTIAHVGWIGEVGVRAGAPDFVSPALERGREAAVGNVTHLEPQGEKRDLRAAFQIELEQSGLSTARAADQLGRHASGITR